MAQWGSKDQANNSVLSAPSQYNKAPTATNRDALYKNETVGAFVENKAVGQFGVKVADATTIPGAHTGWILTESGIGKIESFRVEEAGTGYEVGDVVEAGDALGEVSEIDVDGGIVSIELSDAGDFTEVKETEGTITSTAGADAVVFAIAGGRAGRINHETLVATGSIS